MHYIATLLFIVLALTGCVTPPITSRMIPDLTGITFAKTGKILKVGAVTGGEKTRSLPTIEDDGFQEALIKALEKSYLFKVVGKDQAGDYELETRIISQDMLDSGQRLWFCLLTID